MVIDQLEFNLRARSKGFHLITDEILSNIKPALQLKVGVVLLHLKHTSASLMMNENADPSVRRDFERYMMHVLPENLNFIEHTDEGPDDMPAHIRSSWFGQSLNIPIKNNRLNLGTWQGIYLGEHRDHGGSRQISATYWGKE